jgi:hypothetical protein
MADWEQVAAILAVGLLSPIQPKSRGAAEQGEVALSRAASQAVAAYRAVLAELAKQRHEAG